MRGTTVPSMPAYSWPRFGALCRAIWVDALLCAACGSLFGMVYGAFGTQVHQEFWRAFQLAALGLFTGGAVGTVVGVVRQISENDETPLRDAGSTR